LREFPSFLIIINVDCCGVSRWLAEIEPGPHSLMFWTLKLDFIPVTRWLWTNWPMSDRFFFVAVQKFGSNPVFRALLEPSSSKQQ
jgi:hypothetical protein